MKILFSTSDNSQHSGAFRSTAFLAHELEQLGYECVVVLPSKGTGTKLLQRLGLQYRYVKSYGWTRQIADNSLKTQIKWKLTSLYNAVIAKTLFKRVCREEKASVVHLCTSWTYIGGVAALELGIPLVWHIREFLEEDQGRTIYNRSKGNRLIARSNCVIAISKSIYEKYLKILTNARIEQIYNGIDPADYYVRRDDLFSLQTTRMCIVGGVMESKGQLYLVRALRLMYENDFNDNIRLTIVGEMSNPPTEYQNTLLHEVEKLPKEVSVTFTGSIPNPQDIIRHCDVTVVCSRAEAFGRVTVEAMMAGNVVVGANTFGTCELIDDGVTGYLYEQNSVESLSERLLYILSHTSEAISIASCGQEMALKKYTSKRNAEQISYIYRQITEN